MKKTVQSDNEISDARIKAVAELLLEGIKTREIYARIKSEFKLQNRQIDNLIKSAKDYIKSAGALDISFEKNLMLERLELLFGASFELQDFRTCASILKQKSEFLGLDAPDNVNIAPSTFKIEMTNLTVDDERELKELREFKKKHLKLVS